jgi:probable F420-dependent oxidoreductase
MRIGVVFPTSTIGNDPGGIRDYIQTAEALGFKHILTFDHVLGAGLGTRPNWAGPYSHSDAFHEPKVLFGFMAALTTSIELVTGVLILPQRQTALAAKQAAEVDILTNGRLRLGLGTGWNHVEYEGLNQDFHKRGRRLEEQMALMRALWADELITFRGEFDTIVDAGINPRPINGRIPLWIGGNAEAALKRMARVGDGWFPILSPGPDSEAILIKVRGWLREAGRGIEDFGPQFGMDPVLQAGNNGPQEWARDAEWWKARGATHLSFNTMSLDAIQRAARMGLGLAGGAAATNTANINRKGAKEHIRAVTEFAGVMQGQL